MNKKRKRIALLFTGQPRHWDICSESQLKTFAIEDYDVDCFIHSWTRSHVYSRPDNPNKGLTIYQLRDSDEKNYKTNELYDKLSEVYQPKSMIVEDYFNEKIIEARHLLNKAANERIQTHHVLRSIQGMGTKFINNSYYFTQHRLTQFYSMQEACRLKSEFENKNGFKYDIVVRTRQDLLMQPELDMKDSLEKIVKDGYMGTCCVYKDFNKVTREGGLMGDIVFASSSQDMDSLCLNLFEDLVDIFFKIAKGDIEPEHLPKFERWTERQMYYWGECLLYQIATSKNIKLKYLRNVKFVIYREYMRKLPQEYNVLRNTKDHHNKYKHLFE